MKRAFDICLAGLGLLVWGPLLALIALVIMVFEGRPIFFRQRRVGRHGKPFLIWKFRTMIPNAESQGGALTVGADQRITKLGHWLRKSKLDELPQLFNILSGEMSLVGPRPEVPAYVDLYTEEQRRVLDLVPGITDVASIEYRDESEQLATMNDPETAYIEQVMPEKIRLNLEYAAKANVWQDLLVIFKTFVRILPSV